MSATRQAGAPPELTDAQRTAILSERHTLLEAGAGSGKTTTLVEKILHALGAEVVPGAPVSSPCTLGEIAAITFTKAAAADLRRALRRRLRAHADANPHERKWHRLVYEVDRARIDTIHAFCGGLLRELALRDGRDPGFTQLDDGDAAELREDCARSALHAALAASDPGAGDLAFGFRVEGATRMIRDTMEQGDVAAEARRLWCDEAGMPRLAELEARTVATGRPWRAHDADGARLAATVLRLAADARADYDARLERLNAVDYDALVGRARDLLVRSPEARDGLRRRLRWLFIDEFQDTDPAQRDIAYLVCGIREALAGTPVAGPSLCIIGDPKQSIYGFRRADVTLWSAVARDFAALGAEVAALGVNYRSRAPLVEWVNGVFGGLMPVAGDEAAPDHEVRFRALSAKRDHAGDDGLIELLPLPAGTAGERRRDEAERIARRVRAMVDDAEPIVWDGGEARAPVRWRDVALLFRAKGDIRLYEAELRRLGVPCWVAAGDGFFATREVCDVRLLLTALADAHDDVAWMGLLRSPMVGLTDDALLRLRTERPGVLFAHALDVELPGTDGAALASARTWIAELLALRDRVPCAALVERALERTGYGAALLFQPGGDVALANVRKLVRMADGRPGDSLAGFAHWLVERGESGTREGEAALHTANEDVVTLSTIHGAKGLEWPVVFLVDLDRAMDASARAPNAFVDPVAGIAVKHEDETAADDERQCGAWEALRDRAAARDLAESKRLWYVAATRARDRLVLCAEHPATRKPPKPDAKPKPTAAQWLVDGFTFDGDALRYARWTGRVLGELEPKPEAARVAPPRLATLPTDGATLPPALERQLAAVGATSPLLRRSATEIMTFVKDAAAHRRTYTLGLRESPYAARSSGDGAANAAHGTDGVEARTIGTLVHGALDRDAEELARDLDRILEREIVKELGAAALASFPQPALARLRQLVETTRDHPAVARLFAGDAVERELPFTWFVDVDGEPNVLHGAMDLVARVGAALEILDFKTHRLAAGEEQGATAAYDLQRDVYAAALAEILGTRPSAFSFFFPETGGNVHQPLDDAGVEAGRARLRGVLRDIARAVGVLGAPAPLDADARVAS